MKTAITHTVPTTVVIEFPFPVKQVTDTKVEIPMSEIGTSAPHRAFLNADLLAEAAPELKEYQIDALIDEIHTMVQLERIRNSIKLIIR